MTRTEHKKPCAQISRRRFLKSCTALTAAAGGTISACAGPAGSRKSERAKTRPEVPGLEGRDGSAESPARIERYRVFGRTGFQVSDISLGGSALGDANVIRYAFDRGVNLFDTAETYGSGDSERRIGLALPHLDRKKIHIITKLHIRDQDTEQNILDRVARCLERLGTDYVDSLYMHAVKRAGAVGHAGFHSAVAHLRANGRVKHAGLSCHGPDEEAEDSMEAVVLRAVDDGRFDSVLFAYNFLNPQAGARIIAACREKNVGAACMKTKAGIALTDPFEADEATADERRARIDRFASEHRIRSQQALENAAICWTLSNPALHTACLSMSSIDDVDRFVPLSGTELDARGARLLRGYELALGDLYCRHGCKACLRLCPHRVPVSAIMRRFYYLNDENRRTQAVREYAGLGDRNGSNCLGCPAPCQSACPHNVPVKENVTRAHRALDITPQARSFLS